MVKVLLKFRRELMTEPITSTVILEKGAKVNILRANMHEGGGEMLIEVPDELLEETAEAFQRKGVEVVVKKTITVDEDRCIDCGECFSLCPVDAIQMSTGYKIRFDEDKCVACGICIDACPMRALSIMMS